MSDSQTNEIQLQAFGPSALYRWLYDSWDDLGKISNESKEAVRLLLQYSNRNGNNDEIKRLATSFEYEQLIQAFTLDTFRAFVDSVISGITNNTRSIDDLELSPLALRRELSKSFRHSGIWPEQGFSTLLEEALEACAKAKDQLPRVSDLVHQVHRQQAVESVHDGMDRALLCVERFMEMVLEFLARLNERAANESGAASPSNVQIWLENAGVLPPSKRQPDWGMKEESIDQAAKDFPDRASCANWKHLNPLWHLVDDCKKVKIKNPVTGRDEFDRKKSGKFMLLLWYLRQVRNPVRHASSTLQSAGDVPSAYRKATVNAYRILNLLCGYYWNRQATPALVKLLSYRQDCFGGVEITIATETKRTVVARYINQEMVQTLGITKQPGELISQANVSTEYFLFPAPTSKQHLLFHPLLIERTRVSTEPAVFKFKSEKSKLETPLPATTATPADASIPSRPRGKPLAQQPQTVSISPPQELAEPVGQPSAEQVIQESQLMTDSTGRSFLSYRRSHSDEAALLIAAQHDRGIPTWQDIKELDVKPLGPELRRVLEDHEIANAILWMTPDFSDSKIIQRIETPEIFKRAKQNDAFFVVPVLAGGMDYDKAKDAVDPVYSYEDLRLWNIKKVSGNPIGHDEAVKVANWVLHQRIKTIHKYLEKDQPLRLELNTRKRLPWESGKALLLDWKDRFDDRLAKPGAWEQFLLPALEDVAQAIEQNAPGRAIEASGLIALPAAVALGVCFRATRMQRNSVSWSQFTPERGNQLWSIGQPYEKGSSGFQAVIKDEDALGDDLAVLVNVNDSVEAAFRATQKAKDLPDIRGIVRVTKAGGIRHDLATPGEALDVAHVVVNAINQARNELRGIQCVHLFMAVPAGLAMMIGQLLNKIPVVKTYELISDDGVNHYQMAVQLHPSD